MGHMPGRSPVRGGAAPAPGLSRGPGQPGMALAQMGRADARAEQCPGRLRRLQPADPVLHNNLGCALAAGRVGSRRRDRALFELRRRLKRETPIARFEPCPLREPVSHRESSQPPSSAPLATAPAQAQPSLRVCGSTAGSAVPRGGCPWASPPWRSYHKRFLCPYVSTTTARSWRTPRSAASARVPAPEEGMPVQGRRSPDLTSCDQVCARRPRWRRASMPRTS